jgi:hypothetical protein
MNILQQTARRQERLEALDKVARPLARAVGRAVRPRVVRNLLSGTDLGYPLHPMLTDLPIGAWVMSALLDASAARPPRGPPTCGAYLGGHLCFVLGVEVNRTVREQPPQQWTPVLAETELADGELCRAGAAAATMRCQPPTVNGRHLLSVLVDEPAEDPGQARRRSTGNGGDERAAAKPEELVSLAGMTSGAVIVRWSPEPRDTGCRLGAPR